MAGVDPGTVPMIDGPRGPCPDGGNVGAGGFREGNLLWRAATVSNVVCTVGALNAHCDAASSGPRSGPPSGYCGRSGSGERLGTLGRLGRMPKAHIATLTADITSLEVDAIVNAANRALAGGGGVDGAIHRAAGPARLAAACAELGGCETGDAKWTDGFALPARWIIHTVGPVWRGGDHQESELLASCYRRCIELADELGARTVAFPAISTGVYGFPKEPAARIAVSTLLNLETSVERVVLVAFDEATMDVYEASLSSS